MASAMPYFSSAHRAESACFLFPRIEIRSSLTDFLGRCKDYHGSEGQATAGRGRKSIATFAARIKQ
jgi:hypothetical protein